MYTTDLNWVSCLRVWTPPMLRKSAWNRLRFPLGRDHHPHIELKEPSVKNSDPHVSLFETRNGACSSALSWLLGVRRQVSERVVGKRANRWKPSVRRTYSKESPVASGHGLHGVLAGSSLVTPFLEPTYLHGRCFKRTQDFCFAWPYTSSGLTGNPQIQSSWQRRSHQTCRQALQLFTPENGRVFVQVFMTNYSWCVRHFFSCL